MFYLISLEIPCEITSWWCDKTRQTRALLSWNLSPFIKVAVIDSPGVWLSFQVNVYLLYKCLSLDSQSTGLPLHLFSYSLYKPSFQNLLNFLELFLSQLLQPYWETNTGTCCSCFINGFPSEVCCVNSLVANLESC